MTCCFVVGFPILMFAQSLELNDNAIRKQLNTAATDEQVANELVNTFNHQIDQLTATQMAFHASATGVLCLHTNNPLKQIRYSKDALHIANRAIAMDSTNIDARFARFAIQSELPSVLGLSSNLTEDKAFFVRRFQPKYIQHIPFQSLEAMIHVFDESGLFSNRELLAMRETLYSM